MQAYHNDPELKAQFIRLLEWHKEQDKIVQGTYQDDDEAGAHYTVNGWSFNSFGRGCAVGCSIESLRIIAGRPTRTVSYDDHAAYEELIGVPRILARLEDGIFEKLPVEEARDWPIRFAQAIPVGADLSLVWPRFAMWLLGDSTDGVIRFARTDKQRQAIQAVVDLYLRRLEGNAPTEKEWRAAAADANAYAAAAYAAYAAYAAAADAAAYAAADAWAAAADADADAAAAYAAAAYAADAADAQTQARQKQAAKLLELLRTA